MEEEYPTGSAFGSQCGGVGYNGRLTQGRRFESRLSGECRRCQNPAGPLHHG